MPGYTVKWEVDLDAETPEDAAREALAIHRDPDSLATVFVVMDDSTGEESKIDIAHERE